jgi:hypothetical protein
MGDNVSGGPVAASGRQKARGEARAGRAYTASAKAASIVDAMNHTLRYRIPIKLAKLLPRHGNSCSWVPRARVGCDDSWTAPACTHAVRRCARWEHPYQAKRKHQTYPSSSHAITHSGIFQVSPRHSCVSAVGERRTGDLIRGDVGDRRWRRMQADPRPPRFGAVRRGSIGGGHGVIPRRGRHLHRRR